MGSDFYMTRGVESFLHDISALGGSVALRIMSGQAKASNQEWGEFTVSILLYDLFTLQARSPHIFIECEGYHLYPFEEVFLPIKKDRGDKPRPSINIPITRL
jgi:hypothetical protein